MTIRSTTGFRKKMRKLPRTIQDGFWERLQLFRENARHPLLHDHALTGEWAGCRSLNVTGDYRAIYVVDGSTIRFLAIGTHAELYG